jgi:hypothetical protein
MKNKLRSDSHISIVSITIFLMDILSNTYSAFYLNYFRIVCSKY